MITKVYFILPKHGEPSQGGCHLCQKCHKYHPFYHLCHDFFTLALAFTPIGAGPDHVIKGANQQTLATGDGVRVGVGG